MNNARISVDVGGVRYGFTLEDIDLDAKRDKLALEIGRRVVDTIYEGLEGSE